MTEAMKNIFIRALTEGIMIIGVRNGTEEKFCRLLSENISGDFFHYVEGDYYNLDNFSPMTIVCENKFGPLLRLLVFQEFINFKTEGDLEFSEDKRLVTNFVAEVLRFATAWNKKMTGLMNSRFKVEANNKKYSVKELTVKYNNNIGKIKTDKHTPIV
tara:strand:+ start:1418 stop:1891 length:474 start_codon:yes stop_codon:yes gene_type:complete